jgi:hypothetical protein
MPATEVRGSLAPAASLRLGQNAPNPFGHATSIGFELARSARIRMEVFDVAGRHVRTLVDGVHGAGAHRARWDGRNAAGQPAAAGVYLYRMTEDGSGASPWTRRMTLLR